MTTLTERPKLQIKLSRLDKFVAFVSPKRGFERLREQARYQQTVASLDQAGFIAPSGGPGTYRGATKNSMRGWNITPNTVDMDVVPALPGLRAASRDLAMNAPIASGILTTHRSGTVAAGLRLKYGIDREFLGMDAIQARKHILNVRRRWELWSKSPDCDMRRTLNMGAMGGVALYNTMLSGDCFALMCYATRPNTKHRLAIQLIEADYICNPNFGIDTMRIAGGVEVDDFGAPVAYHRHTLPTDAPILYTQFGGTWDKIPAFGAASGRRNVLHLMKTDRIGQRRGVPLLAQVVEHLKQLSSLSKSELEAAVVTSFFAAFVRGPTGAVGDGSAPLTDNFTDPSVSAINPKSPTDINLMQLSPGAIIELGEGQTGVDFADPKRPNGAFAPFWTAMLQEIAAHTGIPSEMVLKTFNTSYTAAVAAREEAYRAFKTNRHWLGESFYTPVFEAWFEEAVLLGEISAPGFLEDPLYRAAWMQAEWIGPGKGQINPESETNAVLKRIGGRLSTYEREHEEMYGTSWDPDAHALGDELELRRQLKIEPENLLNPMFAKTSPEVPAEPGTQGTEPPPGEKGAKKNDDA